LGCSTKIENAISTYVRMTATNAVGREPELVTSRCYKKNALV